MRRVPIAQALSIPFPFLVIAMLDTERTLFTKDLVIGFAVPSVLYVVLYGLAGDWMLRKAQAKRASGEAEPGLSAGRIVWHLVFSTLMLCAACIIVLLAIVSVDDKQPGFRSAMKADLRNLVTAQEAHRVDHGQYATTLDSLAFAPTSNVSVSLLHADSTSFAAEASYREVTERCRISVGKWAGAPADSLDGVLVCDETGPGH